TFGPSVPDRRCIDGRIDTGMRGNGSPERPRGTDEFRNPARPCLWRTAGAWRLGRHIGLRDPALFQLRPWRHDGLWLHVHHRHDLAVAKLGRPSGPAADGAFGPALRHSWHDRDGPLL